MTDPIADMLTRIRNATRIRREEVFVKKSKICLGVAGVLKEEGYVTDFDAIEDARGGQIRIRLKYGPAGEQIFNQLQRASRPGRRLYRGYQQMPQVMDGLGIAIVSTNRGVFSDRECRKQKLGGEVLCTVS